MRIIINKYTTHMHTREIHMQALQTALAHATQYSFSQIHGPARYISSSVVEWVLVYVFLHACMQLHAHNVDNYVGKYHRSSSNWSATTTNKAFHLLGKQMLLCGVRLLDIVRCRCLMDEANQYMKLMKR